MSIAREKDRGIIWLILFTYKDWYSFQISCRVAIKFEPITEYEIKNAIEWLSLHSFGFWIYSITSQLVRFRYLI